MNIRGEEADVEAILLSEALATTEFELDEADKRKQASPKIAFIIRRVKRRQVQKVLRKADYMNMQIQKKRLAKQGKM